MFSFLPTALSFITGFFKSKSSIMIDIVLGLALVLVVSLGYNKYKSMKTTIALAQKDLQASQKNVILMKDRLKSIKQTNAENMRAFNTQKEKYKKTLILLKKASKRQERIITKVIRIKEGIKYAKKNDDAVTAPVLLNALNRMRNLYPKTENDSSNKNKSRKSKSTE